MEELNPFGAPQHVQQNPHTMAGNPFDPMGSQAAAPPHQQQQPYASAATQTKEIAQNNPFGAAAPPVETGQTMGVQQAASPYQQQQQPPAAAHGGYESYVASPYAPQAPHASPYAPQPQGQVTTAPSPYSAPPRQGQPGLPAEHALVVSETQSNPYAGFVAPARTAPSGNPFDPFAAAPPPPPAPAPVPEPAYTQPQPPQQPQSPQPSAAESMQDFLPPNQQPNDDLGPFGDPLPRSEPVASPKTAPEPRHSEPASHSEQHHQHARPAPTTTPAANRNIYSRELARQAPPGASPLPKSELVRKKGYVLSRISFRTIVTKKWKQTYWVQYGPHTMLWFRSESDFDDWLNNPYHDQTQRNFLIKLAVNFVHDLYKPNVRGYQVTQCRTKAYGRKMVRQFKLERWMDYGPTIAAAFGSYNPKEVDDLRASLVECMRNTPLNGGIRATGAVRQNRNDDGKNLLE